MKPTQITPLLLLLSIFLWTACSEDEKMDVSVTPELEMVKSVNCDWKGTAVAVAIKTNQPAWLATVNEEAAGWCSFIPRRDSIIVKPLENPLNTERRAMIIVTAGGLTDTLEVIQEQGAEPYCRVSEEALHFVWQENTLQVVVSTNQTSWDAVLNLGAGNGEWCSMRKVGNKLVITAERNETDRQMDGEITITAGRAQPVKVSLNQEGKKNPVAGALMFAVTKEFTVSDIYEVWNADQKVAEICYEYIPAVSIKNRVTVVYPVKDGTADLSNGYVAADGGRAEWINGVCNYTPGGVSVPAEKLVVNGGTLSAVIIGNESPATVLPAMLKDGGKNKYGLVKIGMQYWMAENMRTKHYADGSAMGVDYTSKAGAWSLFDDNVTGDKGDVETMGLLYTWYVADRIAPVGWHMPDTVAYRTLLNYLGKENAPLMRKADSRWSMPCNATNLSGFAAIPTGLRWDTGKSQVNSARDLASWWTTTENSDAEPGKGPQAYYMKIEFSKPFAELSPLHENYSFAIRLLKD